MIVSIGVSALLYNTICSTYRAFRFASTKRWELMFAQLVSFGLTDLLFYLEACIANHAYINIIPGVCTVCAQLITSDIIIRMTKSLLGKYIVPKKALFVYGNNADQGAADACFSDLVREHKDILDITQSCSEERLLANLPKFADMCQFTHD